MGYQSFYDLEKACLQFCEEEKYEKALNFFHHANALLQPREYENNQFEILFGEARIYSEIADGDSCMRMVKKALEKGYAFPVDWKRFDLLKKYDDYEKLLAENQRLLETLRKNAKFQYEVQLPLNYEEAETVPLFICLHGDGFGCNIEGSKYHWKADAFLENGYIVAYVQSSQVYGQQCHGWLLDLEKSRGELKNIYDQLLQNYKIDEELVVIGGFSGGASMAIDAVNYNLFPIKGVIAVCPGDHLDELSVGSARKILERETKIVMIEGKKALEPVVQHLLEIFSQSNLSYQYHIDSEIGHEYPKNLYDYSKQALNFIEADCIRK